MSSFHSTVSRREFMKGLGLVSAGAMGAMAGAPAFHDLDELAASGGERKRAWWIKEVHEPTVEMDWSLVKRVHGGHSTQSAAVTARYVGLEKYNAMAKTEAPDVDRCKANEPGYLLRDLALSAANGGTYSGISLAGVTGGVGGVIPTCEADKFGRKKVKTPEQLGVPKWTGTPEEGFKMLRAAMVFFGAMDFGAEELNKNLVGLSGDNPTVGDYNKEPKSSTIKPIVFANQPTFTWSGPTDNITTIPDGIQLHSISYLIPHDLELNRRRPTKLGQTAQTRYRMRRETTTCTQDFIHGLGYQSMADVPYRCMPSGASAVLTGLAENSRHSIMAINPTYGAYGGLFDMLTDLPLANSHPIDAGIWKFCQSCGICAEKCPSGSIQRKGDGEPSYDVRPSATTPVEKFTSPYWSTLRQDAGGEFHKLGRKSFWTDMPTCQLYVRSVAVCNRCWGNCVFNGANLGMIHAIVKGTAATTPLFNSFFATMHETFGYNMLEGEAVETWWDMSRPSYGFNSALFATHTSYG
ncbi:reductive dehalogenase [Dehalogenimonas etheniformans]|uniref:Reductive dehalogenase n=1 Tax=Dehalogenimonas etheniformans TaxID=1536648 RepID=A0A2P5P773_9CHLR|nr:reductive dehalogenase [Dehalogenimonas etheniformans]PPD58153.1 reductive dehalogenase [Dehalogenimonas etheniformans]QNT75561.1 reductive dehalogenase [Dehalogenimonas etheniformans]